MRPGCSHSPGDRVGNVVSRKLSRPTDPERMPGDEISTECTGPLAAESVTLAGKIKINLPTSNRTPEDQALMKQAPEFLEKMSIEVKAERIGDR